MNNLTDSKQTTLSELSKFDGLITLSGDGKGNVQFKGNAARKTKPMPLPM